MDIIEQFIERAKSHRRAVVLPEGDDPRIVRAARRLHDDGIARPMGVEQRQLLLAVHRIAGIVDVQRDGGGRDREGAAEDV